MSSRFQNTVNDLRDCHYHMNDDLVDNNEIEARQQIIARCADIAINYGYIVGRECIEIE